MCEMLAEKLTQAGIPFSKIVDRKILEEKNITHVPMLETGDGELLSLAQALKYIKGVTA